MLLSGRLSSEAAIGETTKRSSLRDFDLFCSYRRMDSDFTQRVYKDTPMVEETMFSLLDKEIHIP